jgi:DNA modification methylase
MTFSILQANTFDIPVQSGSVNTVVTSPPYWGLRDYGVSGQLGQELTPEEYVSNLVTVFREVRRTLSTEGTLWLNLGDSYAGSRKGQNSDGSASDRKKAMQGSNRGTTTGGLVMTLPGGLKPKDLVGIPWRVALALQADGWWLRSDIIWHKPNAFPESVRDRPTKSHEYVFLLSKSQRYYYDKEAILEPSQKPHGKGYRKDAKKAYLGNPPTNLQGCGSNPKGRNRRTLWSISTKPFKGAHFATFPPDLVEICILAGCPEGGIVLDPFGGSGTTALVANKLGRHGISLDLSRDYCKMAYERCK